MKRKMDFEIRRDNDYCRDIFRFYPRRTHVHGFRITPPADWSEVYKVYYSWAIIRQYFDDDGIKLESSIVLLSIPCDENSRLSDLANIIRYVMETGEIFDTPTFGQPAGDWKIVKDAGKDDFLGDYEYYHFQVFNSLTDQGFRFTLDKKQALAFCDWLDQINEYALKHGEGI